MATTVAVRPSLRTTSAVCSSFSTRRAASTRSAPAPANTSAKWAPKPLDAPVINTVLPCREKISFMLVSLCFLQRVRPLRPDRQQCADTKHRGTTNLRDNHQHHEQRHQRRRNGHGTKTMRTAQLVAGVTQRTMHHVAGNRHGKKGQCAGGSKRIDQVAEHAESRELCQQQRGKGIQQRTAVGDIHIARRGGLLAACDAHVFPDAGEQAGHEEHECASEAELLGKGHDGSGGQLVVLVRLIAGVMADKGGLYLAMGVASVVPCLVCFPWVCGTRCE